MGPWRSLRRVDRISPLADPILPHYGESREGHVNTHTHASHGERGGGWQHTQGDVLGDITWGGGKLVNIVFHMCFFWHSRFLISLSFYEKV